MATTLSLKQGETRTSHGPIPHPLSSPKMLLTPIFHSHYTFSSHFLFRIVLSTTGEESEYEGTEAPDIESEYEGTEAPESENEESEVEAPEIEGTLNFTMLSFIY